MGSDPRFISPSDRGAYPSPTEIEEGDLVTRCRLLFAHAAFMDERDARQRDLIRRLAEAIQEDLEWCESVGREPCRTCKLIAEARGIEATNE